MLNINIEKELDKKKVESENESSLLTETKLLLEGEFVKEREILKTIGLGHHIIAAEKQRGLNLERQRMETEFEGKVFTSTEIKDLCLDYDLRFLQSTFYKGTLDLEIGPKLKHFFEKHKLNSNYDNQNFYILAPKQSFNLSERPKPAPIDPILFYRPNRNEDKLLMVHKWGNDFTIARLFLGAVRRTAFTQFAFRWTIATGLVNIIWAMWGSYSPVIDAIPSIAIGALVAFASMYATNKEDEWSDVANHYNDKCWNEAYK